MKRKKNVITFITPDDPEYRFLRHRKNVVVVTPEGMDQILPSVFGQIEERSRVYQEKIKNG